MSGSLRRLGSILTYLVGSAGVASAGFTIQDLGVISPSGTSGGMAINASGQVAGSASNALGNSVAVRTNGVGGFQPISASGLGTSSQASSINASGQVAGTYVDSNGNRRGFSTSSGGVQTVNPLTGGTFTQVNGINRSSELVGTGNIGDGTTRAFTATPGGPATAINPLGTGTSNQGNGINDGGTVVGTSSISPDGPVHAFLAPQGSPVIDLLSRNSGPSNFSYNIYGIAIANNGDVTGYGDVGRYEHAFYAPSSGGPLIDLGVLPGGSSSKAYGLNNMAQVVGAISYSSISPGQPGSEAFLWDTNQGMFNLNLLISTQDQANWTLTQAAGINDSDQITGVGLLGGVAHGFLLTPIAGESIFEPAGSIVPEPPAYLLASIGLAIVAVGARFRSRLG